MWVLGVALLALWVDSSVATPRCKCVGKMADSYSDCPLPTCATVGDPSGSLSSFSPPYSWARVKEEFGEDWVYDPVSGMVMAMGGKWMCSGVSIPEDLWRTATASCSGISIINHVWDSTHSVLRAEAVPEGGVGKTVSIGASVNATKIDIDGISGSYFVVLYGIPKDGGKEVKLYTSPPLTSYCTVYATAWEMDHVIRGDEVRLDFDKAESDPAEAWISADSVFVAPKDGLYSMALSYADVATHPLDALKPHTHFNMDDSDASGVVPNRGTSGAGTGSLLGCCGFEATGFTTPTIGNKPHSLVMYAKFLAGKESLVRQWILNLGQMGSGAEHWLENSYVLGGHSMPMQFGIWGGAQIQKAFDTTRADHEQVLVTTWDSTNYCFYVDGDLIQCKKLAGGFNIKEARLRAGKRPPGWGGSEGDFNGAVRRVAYFDRVLSRAEVTSMVRPECEVVEELFSIESIEPPRPTFLKLNGGSATYSQDGNATVVVTSTPSPYVSFAFPVNLDKGWEYTFSLITWGTVSSPSGKLRLVDSKNKEVASTAITFPKGVPTKRSFTWVAASPCWDCTIEIVFMSTGPYSFDNLLLTYNCTHDTVSMAIEDESGMALCRATLPGHPGETAAGACQATHLLKEGDILEVKSTAEGTDIHKASGTFTAHLVDHSYGHLRVSYGNVKPTGTTNGYNYVDFLVNETTPVVLASGDVLEYDIFWEQATTRVGLDLELTGAGALRNLRPVVVDQNGVAAHPAADLSKYAFGSWYHRKIPIPDSVAGKQVHALTIACEVDDGTSASVRVRDIYINRGGRRLVLWEFSMPIPTNALLFSSPPKGTTYNVTSDVTSVNSIYTTAMAMEHESMGPPTLIEYPGAMASTGVWNGSVFTVPKAGLYSLSTNFIRDAVPYKAYHPLGYWDLSKRGVDGGIRNEGIAPGGDGVKAGCCGFVASGFYPGDWGVDQHTIAMSTVLPDPADAKARMWLLNLGQSGTGAHHWLDGGDTGAVQFGVWNGPQLSKKFEEFRKPDQAQSLITTWDGTNYKLYIDGNLVAQRTLPTPFNIKGSNLTVGHAKLGGSGETDYTGRTTEVAFYDRALNAREVASLTPRGSHEDTAIAIQVNDKIACGAKVGAGATHGLGSCSVAMVLKTGDMVSTWAMEAGNAMRHFFEIWTDIHLVSTSGHAYGTAILDKLTRTSTDTTSVSFRDAIKTTSESSFDKKFYTGAGGVYSAYVSFHKVVMNGGFAPGAWTGPGTPMPDTPTELKCLVWGIKNGARCMNWSKNTKKCYKMNTCTAVLTETKYLDSFDYADLWGMPAVKDGRWKTLGTMVGNITDATECMVYGLLDGVCGVNFQKSTKKCYITDDCTSGVTDADYQMANVGYSKDVTMTVKVGDEPACMAHSGRGTNGQVSCTTSKKVGASVPISVEMSCNGQYNCKAEDIHFTAHRVHG